MLTENEVANYKPNAIRDKFADLYAKLVGGSTPEERFGALARFSAWLRVLGADAQKGVEIAHLFLVGQAHDERNLNAMRVSAAQDAAAWIDSVNSKAHSLVQQYQAENPPPPPPKPEKKILKLLTEGYDWEYVFAYGKPDPAPGEEQLSPRPVDTKPFGTEDVSIIHGYSFGENDGDDWIMWGKLHDGRYFFISAWCDYTGWGCQEGGRSYVSGSEEGIKKVISFDDIARMGRKVVIAE